MSVFKRRRFPAEIILLCVRWYCRYGISYRDLEEMMAERGVAVDHVTLYRWIQRYAPELEKRVRWYQGYRSSSWRVDETYVRVGGKWKYLFRAVTAAWSAMPPCSPPSASERTGDGACSASPAIHRKPKSTGEPSSTA